MDNKKHTPKFKKREDSRRPDNPDRPGRTGMPEKPENKGRSYEKRERPVWQDRPSRPERSDRPSRPDRPARYDRPSGAERSNRPSRPDRPGRYERPSGPERPQHPVDQPTLVGDVLNLSYSAASVVRHEGKVAFIPYTVPGDVVRFSVENDKKTFMEGRLVELLKSSPHRRTPQCPYFGRCGGCQWQHVAYDYQVRAKKKITKDLLERIGDLNNPPIAETHTAGSEWYYRHRVRFQTKAYRKGVHLGFSIYNSHDVVDIESCSIVVKPILELLKKLRSFRNELEKFYDFEVYYSEKENAFMFSGICKDQTAFEDIKQIPSLFKGGVLTEKRGKKSVYFKEPWMQYTINAPTPYLLKVYANGFIQANSAVNEQILHVIAEELKDCKGKRALELFAGSGNFSLLLGSVCSYVHAVEGATQSFKALEENITRNGAMNISAVRSETYAEVVNLFNRKRKFDVVFLDPPRNGAKELMPFIPKLEPSVILYLSCNPSTLARDVKTLVFNGYELTKVIPFDMFPQTFHIENLAVLRRRNGESPLREL